MNQTVEERSQRRLLVEHIHIGESDRCHVGGVRKNAVPASANRFVKRRIRKRFAGLRQIQNPPSIEDFGREKRL